MNPSTVTSAKIVHDEDDFKGGSRLSAFREKPLKDHLICISGGAFALLGGAHRPGQKRQAEQVAGDPWRSRRQFMHPIGDEMRPGVEGMAKMRHAAGLGRRSLRP